MPGTLFSEMLETTVGNSRSLARSAPLVEYSGKACANTGIDTKPRSWSSQPAIRLAICIPVMKRPNEMVNRRPTGGREALPARRPGRTPGHAGMVRIRLSDRSTDAQVARIAVYGLHSTDSHCLPK
jgi:hypothetical protein